MKMQRVLLVIIYIIILIIVLLLRYFEIQTGFFKLINPIFLTAIVVVGFIYTLRSLKRKNKKKNGIPKDDELSLLIKYKTGYYSYLASLFLWYMLFAFRDHFPDIETILGGGLLISVLIVIITRIIIKRFPDE